MPLFLVERNFAEQLNLTPAEVSRIAQVKSEVGINWLYTFLSADEKRTFCVYEASSAEVFTELAQRLGAPVGEIIELSHEQTIPQTESPYPAL